MKGWSGMVSREPRDSWLRARILLHRAQEALMDHPFPWLKIVETDDLATSGVDFGKLKVRTASGDDLGKVDGFVVDTASGRPYYIVVNAGGWFRSKHYLLPVGHGRLDADGDAIVTDLTRERVNNFPGFDKDEFGKLTEDDLKKL